MEVIRLKFLVLAPHPDDEISCSSYVKKLSEEGHDGYYVNFSWCDKSLPEGYDRNDLKMENKKSINELDLERVFCIEYPVREFQRYRQGILESMIKIRKDIKPDIVFCPCSRDIHQDHKVINEETKRCFRDKTILGYIRPYNMYKYSPNLFFRMNNDDIELKKNLISIYKSQIERNSQNESKFTLANEKYEMYEVIRWFENE